MSLWDWKEEIEDFGRWMLEHWIYYVRKIKNRKEKIEIEANICVIECISEIT